MTFFEDVTRGRAVCQRKQRCFCFNLLSGALITFGCLRKYFLSTLIPLFVCYDFHQKTRSLIATQNKLVSQNGCTPLNSLHTWLFEVTSYSHQVVHKKFSEECVFSPRCPRRNWRVPYRCRRAVPSRAVEPVSPCAAVPCALWKNRVP